MSNPVVFFEIAGKNTEKLCEFYTTVFGWKMNPSSNNVIGVDTCSEKGITGIIHPVEDDSDYTNHVIIYVRVSDLETSTKKLEQLGGKVFVPPQAIPDNMGSFAIFTDPSGNFIGILQNP